MSPEVIAGHADIISTINTAGAAGAGAEGAAVNLSEVPHDRVLEFVQQLDLPFLRGTFEAINAPGADTAIEATGELIFNQLIPLSAALLLPVQVVVLAVEARSYHKKEYNDAANVLREIARKKEEDGREIDRLVADILGDQKRSKKDVGVSNSSGGN